ncbi:MAG: dioxygenase [Rickettsiaceae bacterium]|jgi:protocatechuate 3,4-dioxygenase beta subunit|nr:dioxygenase [Rickettsiaceae bacterium]
MVSIALAGGGDGSEVLGGVKKDAAAGEDKSLMDSLKDIFEKDKEGGEENTEEKQKSKSKKADGSDGEGAAESEDDNAGGTAKKATEGIIMECTVTPSIYPDNIPQKKIKKSNNLMRKPGSARRAEGQYIEIRGKVVDEDCFPIEGAEVQIWQTDATGKYEDDYTPTSEWDLADKDMDKNFGYSGAAQTNNLGEFSFITVLPGMKNNEMAPHINYFVRQPEFREVATMMFFDKHPKNDTDKNLKKLTSDDKERVIAHGKKLDPTGRYEGRVYNFVVVLEGVSKYRRY